MDGKRYKIERVSGQPVADVELIADLKRVAEQTGRPTVGQKEYRRLGKYDDSTATRRFGSWNSALVAAGLELSNSPGLTDDQLFENLLRLWSHYGRQPRRSELAVAPSTISQSPYLRRFGSWGSALKRFVEFADTDESAVTPSHRSSARAARRTPRDPDLRLRFRVLQRDRFTCRSCGSSPAKSMGVELHVDHIDPWSKGGETVIGNLQTLCDRCNLGKGNMTDEAE
ncbi:MAG: HNH endonuclease [Deltaproteobacteria bacterium]|nr:MAG: HNH endonuclease [Deltaproteobacteria bacterium]